MEVRNELEAEPFEVTGADVACIAFSEHRRRIAVGDGCGAIRGVEER